MDQIKVKTFVCMLLLQSVAAAADTAKHPDAAAILDRYVEVTGGKAAYRAVNASVVEITLTIAGQTIEGTVYQSRDGRSRSVLRSGAQTIESGVVKGVAWRLTSASGGRILQGKEAESEIASAKNFLEDDWRNQYSKSTWSEAITINGKLCDGISRVRTDGEESEVYFDRSTGLRTREVTFSPGSRTVEKQYDTVEYATAAGIRYPKSFRILQGGASGTLTVESVVFSAEPPKDAFVWPEFVVREVAHPGASRIVANSGLPSASALFAKFLEKTGGKDSYAAIKTQHLKGTMSFNTMNLSASFESFEAAGQKSYVTMELPGAGKFEFGSNGSTAWEKSTLTGARIVPLAQRSGGLTGPGPDQIVAMLETGKKFQTVEEQNANGAPCFLVRPIGAVDSKSPSMCFDKASGFLTRMSTVAQTQMGAISADMILTDYRPESGVQMAHRIQTTVAGQPVNLEITSVTINDTIPEDTFVLPKDVQALRDKQAAQAPKEAEPDPAKPTLRRSH